MPRLTGIKEAVAHAGSQKKLAEELGVSKQVVQLWMKHGYVPNNRIRDIEKLYGIEPQRLCDPEFVELLTHKKDEPEK